MQFFTSFLSLYMQHFSAIDWLITILGIVVCLLQLLVLAKAKLATVPKQGPQFVKLRSHMVSMVRVATLATDGFPLLGLLGTVASLLVTFAGMHGSAVSSNIISDFAPGLTSTVSGLLWSIINLIVLQLFLIPGTQHVQSRGRIDG